MPTFRFSYPIDVRYGDLDPQGHVNNAHFLTYFEQARLHYLIHLGLFARNASFLELGVIVADAHVNYLAPVFLGMNLRVETGVNRLGNKSFNMAYRLVDVDSGAELATGATALVTFDYHTEKTVPIPADWRQKISEFEHL